MKNFAISLMIAFLVSWFSPSGNLWAEDQDKAGEGAMVGASTQVLTSTSLDYVTNPDGLPEDPNKVVLKRAVVGAVTGATAASMTADSNSSKVDVGVAAKSDENTTLKLSVNEEHKSKKKWKWKFWERSRPPGWDRGKKTGWGDSDVPPGLANKTESTGESLKLEVTHETEGSVRHEKHPGKNKKWD